MWSLDERAARSCRALVQRRSIRLRRSLSKTVENQGLFTRACWAKSNDTRYTQYFINRQLFPAFFGLSIRDHLFQASSPHYLNNQSRGLSITCSSFPHPNKSGTATRDPSVSISHNCAITAAFKNLTPGPTANALIQTLSQHLLSSFNRGFENVIRSRRFAWLLSRDFSRSRWKIMVTLQFGFWRKGPGSLW